MIPFSTGIDFTSWMPASIKSAIRLPRRDGISALFRLPDARLETDERSASPRIPEARSKRPVARPSSAATEQAEHEPHHKYAFHDPRDEFRVDVDEENDAPIMQATWRDDSRT